MKFHFIIFMACPFLIIHNNNNKGEQSKLGNSLPHSDVAARVHESHATDDDITGFWKLKLEAYDDNGNKILDEAERKKGFKNNYSFRFNADGSCKIVESFKGRYEVKTENGNKMLYVFRNRVAGEEKQDPPPDVYRIISLSKNELVVLEQEGNLTFWVFERSN
jgi:hypothetical protein